MRIFNSVDEVLACVDQEVAVTEWRTVTQENINQFADATNDHQWIHVDIERAQRGPFGSTIAHGFLTLSLLSGFLEEAVRVNGVNLIINYGLNRVRFTAVVPVGSRLRARLKLQSTTPIKGGHQVCWLVTIEREGSEKPACVAESLMRYYTDAN